MRRLILLPLIALFVLAATACASSTHAPEFTPSASTTASLIGDGQPALRTITATFGGETVVLEVADGAGERTSGLSGRDGLAEGAGMLFVWDEEAAHTLWMKDMRFALDFVWLDVGRRVVQVDRDVQPQPGASDGDLVRYSPPTPVKYAIEVTAGEAARLGVAVGDVIAFDEGAD